MTNPFLGLPRIESLLFPALKAELGLIGEEERIADDLHQKGYAVFTYSNSDLDDRSDRIRSHLGSLYGVDFNAADSDKTAGERQIQDAWTFDADVRAIAANQEVMDLLSKLYGRRAMPFQTLNFPFGTQQDAHTDFLHFSSLPERFMCGVWLALEDIGSDAGLLFYYPESHRWLMMSNALIRRRGHGIDLAC